MGGICSCGRYSRYVIDSYDDEECEEEYITGVEPMVQVNPTKIVYKGGGSGSSGDHRSLEKLVEGGMVEVNTYLLFKNTSIRELGIVRSHEGGIVVEFGGEMMSLAKFCKRAGALHGKTWNGTPWNCVYTIDEDEQPLMRIDHLWESMITSEKKDA